jgi:hypothetical protein
MAGLVFRRDADGAASHYRAFVLAYPAADAMARIHIGLLQKNGHLHRLSAFGRARPCRAIIQPYLAGRAESNATRLTAV